MKILIYFIFRDHVIRYLLLPIPPQQNQVLVDLQPGTTMAIAMMKTTMKNVDGTGKTVVALMLIQHIVMIVHALIPNQILIQLQRHQQKFVALHNGKETISVMIKIIMKDVVGMVKIVVVTMLI